MPLASLDHVTIRTPDLDAVCRFYVEVLGLCVGERPPFSFPGAWLYGGNGTPVLHLIGITAEEEILPAAGTGPIDHIAFAATGLKEMRRRLRERNVTFSEREVPVLGLRQIFVHDPHGTRIELNFSAAEAAE